MRIAGWILLIAGALLCATLVWATVGFLLMGVGLLSLLVAENNRKRASHPVVERAPPDDANSGAADPGTGRPSRSPEGDRPPAAFL